jgi:hypothetical protein
MSVGGERSNSFLLSLSPFRRFNLGSPFSWRSAFVGGGISAVIGCIGRDGVGFLLKGGVSCRGLMVAGVDGLAHNFVILLFIILCSYVDQSRSISIILRFPTFNTGGASSMPSKSPSSDSLSFCCSSFKAVKTLSMESSNCFLLRRLKLEFEYLMLSYTVEIVRRFLLFWSSACSSASFRTTWYTFICRS